LIKTRAFSSEKSYDRSRYRVVAALMTGTVTDTDLHCGILRKSAFQNASLVVKICRETSKELLLCIGVIGTYYLASI
jgi:hypothetical protein